MGRCRLCTSAVAVTAALLVIIRTHAAPLERRLQHPQLTRATGLEVLQQARSPLGLKTKRPEAFNHLMMPVTTLRGGSSDRHEAALESSSRTGLRHCSKVLYETSFDLPWFRNALGFDDRVTPLDTRVDFWDSSHPSGNVRRRKARGPW